MYATLWHHEILAALFFFCVLRVVWSFVVFIIMPKGSRKKGESNNRLMSPKTKDHSAPLPPGGKYAYGPWVDAYLQRDADDNPYTTDEGRNCCNVKECHWESEGTIMSAWNQPEEGMDAFVYHLAKKHKLTGEEKKKSKPASEPVLDAEDDNKERSLGGSTGGGGGVLWKAMILSAIVVAALGGVTHNGTEENIAKMEQRQSWHGCSCIDGGSHQVFLPLLSTRARHGTARFTPTHLDTSHSSSEVLDWAKRVLSSSSCTDVVGLSSHRLESVEEWGSFLHNAIENSKGRTCHIIVVGFTQLHPHIIDSWKEVAESNTLRGHTVLPDGHQGLLMLVADGGREWLLNQVQHRTVHVMSTVKLQSL